MSKGDILRSFVSERLAIATQEILGVVDKLVAGYEEEASSFRQEIKRQQRELEVLLQEQQGLYVVFETVDVFVTFTIYMLVYSAISTNVKCNGLLLFNSSQTHIYTKFARFMQL